MCLFRGPLSRQSNSPKRTTEQTLAVAGTKESKKIARTGSPFAWRLLGIVPGPFPGPIAVRSDRFHQRLSRFHMEKWTNPVSSLWWQVIESGRRKAEGFPSSIPTALEGHDPVPGNRPGEKHMHFIRQFGGTPRTIERISRVCVSLGRQPSRVAHDTTRVIRYTEFSITQSSPVAS